MDDVNCNFKSTAAHCIGLRDVDKVRKPSRKEGREVIVAGALLCDGERECGVLAWQDIGL